MLAHKSGMIGLPLRLLAREIYDRIVAARGAQCVALVTGEEKIVPRGAQYWVATVEAMPFEREVDFMAIDEIQLAADPERGRIFTSRILHARGRQETLFLGSDTMRPVLKSLFGDIQFLSRERFSRLTYAGLKKLTRLPRRSAIVAFSSDMVYAVAELIRRQRGGAAVVLGALSPRTRNAQAELYQSGDVDFLVATDAIGMGLNMDIDHVAFAGKRKFDGVRSRDLTPAELAQVAGRAGRHINDGTFGVTADCSPFDEDDVLKIEEHSFDPVAALQWRTEKIDLTSIPALMNSLKRAPHRPALVRSRREDDEDALHRLLKQKEIRDLATGGAALSMLWEICQIPDFCKVAFDQHARLLSDLYLLIMKDGRIANDWLELRVKHLERTDGDIDAISSRIAHVRTWTYLSHRAQWFESAAYWQERTRAIEDKLSDALHEKLTQRFVDRRTSALMKRLKDDAPLLAGVTDDGEVIVEGQFVGRLQGFEFIIDPRAKGAEAKSLRAAGQKALRPVLATRAAALANCGPDELSLGDDGSIWWRSARVAKLEKGPAPLRPNVVVSGLSEITPNMRGRVEDRIKKFVVAKIEGLLGPLVALNAAANTEGEDALKGVTKGVAYRLVENFGATSRTQFGDDLKQIDQPERGKLRKLGMRFGEYTLFIPAILKPASAQLLVLLWALWTDRNVKQTPPPKAGLVNLEMAENLPHAYYYAAGYRPSGNRAVRIDMLERLAGLIRSARNEASREGFEATPQMMSLVGCSGEDFEAIMRSLGLRKHIAKRKKVSPEAKPEAPPKSKSEASPKTAKENTEAAKSEDPASDDTESKAVAAPETKGVSEIAAPVSENDPPAANANPAPFSDAANDASPEPVPTDAKQPEAEQADSATDEEKKPHADIGTGVEEIEVALWRPAPRKNYTKQKRNDTRSGNQKFAKGKHGKPDGRGRPDRGGKPGVKRGAPRRQKKADPDSPFAVLAGLKSQLSSGDDKKSKKESEKAK
ncbi:MAG: disulfide oxidoreductase [Marinicaulis sp.]|nr:disulfide oxidoreductase [Marinicaulis sp.]